MPFLRNHSYITLAVIMCPAGFIRGYVSRGGVFETDNMEQSSGCGRHRRIIFEAIVKYRKMKNQGVVAVFKRDRFDRYSNFARIGDGSLGGKGADWLS
ncbi:hypothetical protein BFINE_55140 [Bacteroides finegoldii DSM 17565]|nr:hypothetical protein BFINE_55140 [Bacteroides finegoldii DSM 17565]